MKLLNWGKNVITCVDVEAIVKRARKKTQVEEETELKNHMKWARILVANDGRSIPKEVTVAHKGVIFHLPIWMECKLRFELFSEKEITDAGEEASLYREMGINQRIFESSLCDDENSLNLGILAGLGTWAAS
ncbi:hypothetical protein H5410_042351 [Solanum commersonii]|uniref:Uncharacterized protein n=1 Tax=Solanum commersonii TaxID=4109 RepID=A0A9J5XVH1_SOLCO|nr:hypothetical protein H5410_042351 [Solanum commersonii]